MDKKCTSCGQVKDIEEFPKSSCSRWYSNICMDCRRIRNKKGNARRDAAARRPFFLKGDKSYPTHLSEKDYI